MELSHRGGDSPQSLRVHVRAATPAGLGSRAHSLPPICCPCTPPQGGRQVSEQEPHSLQQRRVGTGALGEPAPPHPPQPPGMSPAPFHPTSIKASDGPGAVLSLPLFSALDRLDFLSHPMQQSVTRTRASAPSGPSSHLGGDPSRGLFLNPEHPCWGPRAILWSLRHVTRL